MWRCKDCGTSVSRRSELLRYYKLDHRCYGSCHSHPCIFFHCPCTCKTWNTLLSQAAISSPRKLNWQHWNVFNVIVINFNFRILVYVLAADLLQSSLKVSSDVAVICLLLILCIVVILSGLTWWPHPLLSVSFPSTESQVWKVPSSWFSVLWTRFLTLVSTLIQQCYFFLSV